MTPGEVVRVRGEAPQAAFRVLRVDGGTVHCYGGVNERMAFRSFTADRVGAVVPRVRWPALLLPPEERPEAARHRSEKRTARKLAKA